MPQTKRTNSGQLTAPEGRGDVDADGQDDDGEEEERPEHGRGRGEAAGVGLADGIGNDEEGGGDEEGFAGEAFREEGHGCGGQQDHGVEQLVGRPDGVRAATAPCAGAARDRAPRTARARQPPSAVRRASSLSAASCDGLRGASWAAVAVAGRGGRSVAGLLGGRRGGRGYARALGLRPKSLLTQGVGCRLRDSSRRSSSSWCSSRGRRTAPG